LSGRQFDRFLLNAALNQKRLRQTRKTRPSHTRPRVDLVITYWFAQLHTAAVLGVPMKLFVCAMGLVIATLAVTGVYIWWRKRAARAPDQKSAA
jgi:uncharacterized iron-regulated membrane protein